MTVTAKDYMSTTTAVATVGTTFGDVFSAVEVSGACSAFAGAAMYFYVVDEVGISHLMK